MHSHLLVIWGYKELHKLLVSSYQIQEMLSPYHLHLQQGDQALLLQSVVQYHSSLQFQQEQLHEQVFQYILVNSQLR